MSPPIAERLEKATCADPSLDEAIYLALRPANTPEELTAHCKGNDELYWYWVIARSYTYSVDAALALTERVLPGQWWDVLEKAMGMVLADSPHDPDVPLSALPLAILRALFSALSQPTPETRQP